MKKREIVTAFDFENAFKALEEIEIPKVTNKQRNLSEHFVRSNVTNALMEDYYDVNNVNELEQAQNSRQEEIAQAKLARIEKIVDINAESPEDILPSYVGKTVIQCPQCMTLFYKDPADVEVSEEDEDICNASEVCQHCGNDSGYTLIGKIEAIEDVEEEPQLDEVPVDLESNQEEDSTENNDEVDSDISDIEEEPVNDENDESLNIEPIGEEDTEDKEVQQESLVLHEKNTTLDKVEPILDRALSNTKRSSKEDASVLLNLSSDKYVEAEKRIKEWAKSNNINIFEIDARILVDETIFTGMPFTGDDGKTSTLVPKYWDQIKENTVLLFTNITSAQPRTMRHILTLIREKKTPTKDLRDKILFSIISIISNTTDEEDLDPVIRARVPFKISDTSLKEAVDKELDDKLKAHNDYIEYLKNEIKKAEKELENAKNEFVKKSIEVRLESLKADLEAALPDVLKDEVQNKLPDADEVEEVKESLTESINIQDLYHEDIFDNPYTALYVARDLTYYFVGDPDDAEKLVDDWATNALEGYEQPIMGDLIRDALVAGNWHEESEEWGTDTLPIWWSDRCSSADKAEMDKYINACKNDDDRYHLLFLAINSLALEYGDEWYGFKESFTNVKKALTKSLKEEVIRDKVLIKNEFYLGDPRDVFSGYYDPNNRWNGWANPGFEKDEADRLAEVMNVGNNKEIFKYDANLDAFLEYDEQFEEEGPIKYVGEDRATEDGIKHLYFIGASSWIWCEKEEELVEENLKEESAKELLQDFANSLGEDVETEEKLAEFEKSLEESTDVQDNFVDDVSREEFKAMLNDPIYYESFEEEKDDFEELDECSLNEHISGYLTNVYENVKSFEATNCSYENNKLMIEGNINFNSGSINKTKFEFIKESNTFVGENKDLCEGLNFTLNYINKNKTIVTESFKYKYTIGKNLVEGIIKK